MHLLRDPQTSQAQALKSALLSFSALSLALELGCCNDIPSLDTAAAEIYSSIKAMHISEPHATLALRAKLQYHSVAFAIQSQCSTSRLPELCSEIIANASLDSLEDIFCMLLETLPRASFQAICASLFPIVERCVTLLEESLQTCSQPASTGRFEEQFSLVIDSLVAGFFNSAVEDVSFDKTLLVLARKHAVLQRSFIVSKCSPTAWYRTLSRRYGTTR